MELHPDRNQDDPTAESKFKEANEAYDVLKDADKKAAYDQYGHAAFEGCTRTRAIFAQRLSSTPAGTGSMRLAR